MNELKKTLLERKYDGQNTIKVCYLRGMQCANTVSSFLTLRGIFQSSVQGDLPLQYIEFIVKRELFIDLR